jgi:hypothetical protein
MEIKVGSFEEHVIDLLTVSQELVRVAERLQEELREAKYKIKYLEEALKEAEDWECH